MRRRRPIRPCACTSSTPMCWNKRKDADAALHGRVSRDVRIISTTIRKGVKIYADYGKVRTNMAIQAHPPAIHAQKRHEPRQGVGRRCRSSRDAIDFKVMPAPLTEAQLADCHPDPAQALIPDPSHQEERHEVHNAQLTLPCSPRRPSPCSPARPLAQNFPNKPVKLILPYNPGGIIDYVGRHAGQGLSEPSGRRSWPRTGLGAGGIPGTDTVARDPRRMATPSW